MSWFRQFVDKYLAPLVSFASALLLLAAFMYWWSASGYKVDVFGLPVVQSFGTLLVAISALYAGMSLRKRQEEAANAKAQLALNVELSTRVVPRQAGRAAIAVEVRVKNVSSHTWNLPLVYVFLYPVELPQTEPVDSVGVLEVLPPEVYTLRGRNIARFPNTMTRLSPDEEDVYTNFFLIDDDTAKQGPYYLVLVEAVGAPDSRNFDRKKRDAFIGLLDGELVNGRVSSRPENETEAERKARLVRDTYMLVESSEPDLKKKYGRRVLILPPSERSEAAQAGRVDAQGTEFFRGMLENTMMWTRAELVCVGALQARSGV